MKEIFERRSVRRFADQKIEAEKMEKILRAGMQAPSAMNQQPWEFLVVESPEKIQQIKGMSPYAKPLETAKAALVLCGYMQDLPAAEYWQQDLGACTQNVLLEAHHLGLGTVWMGVAPGEDRMRYISKCFSLPEHVVPFCVIAMGYPESPVQPVDRFRPERVHYETY